MGATNVCSTHERHPARGNANGRPLPFLTRSQSGPLPVVKIRLDGRVRAVTLWLMRERGRSAIARLHDVATVEKEFERLLHDRLLRTVFQPIVSVETRAVVGYEGLVR